MDSCTWLEPLRGWIAEEERLGMVLGNLLHSARLTNDVPTTVWTDAETSREFETSYPAE